MRHVAELPIWSLSAGHCYEQTFEALHHFDVMDDEFTI